MMRMWGVCVTVAWASIAQADPAAEVRARYEDAARLADDGEYEKALELVEQGLAVAPKNLDLLGLKGTILIKLRDYSGALTVYRAYLDAGVKGTARREAQQIIENLDAVPSTFIELSLTNGPANIYLDSKAQGLFCQAGPSCTKSVLSGEYSVIAERPGFEPSLTPTVVETGKTTKLAITLIEQPSQLTVRTEPAGARVAVDDAAYTAPATIKAGKHRIVVSLPDHLEERREVEAHEGKPIELDVTLTRIIPVRTEPPDAVLLLDGKPAALQSAGLAIPSGAHVLVAQAPGFHDRQVEIPAERGSDYQLQVKLDRVAAPSGRKLALVMGGIGLVAAGTGLVLNLQDLDREDNINTRRASERRGFAAALSYGVALFAVGFSVHFWVKSKPRARVAITPRLGSVAGVDLGMKF